MKKILFLLLLVSAFAQAQTDEEGRYTWYKFQYGMRLPRLWGDSVFHAPYLDTTVRPSRPGAFMMRQPDKLWYGWNGTKWNLIGAADSTGALNGLSLAGKNVKLGGSLMEPTTINGQGNTLDIDSLNVLRIVSIRPGIFPYWEAGGIIASVFSGISLGSQEYNSLTGVGNASSIVNTDARNRKITLRADDSSGNASEILITIKDTPRVEISRFVYLKDKLAVKDMGIGSENDSAVVWNSTDKQVKKIAPRVFNIANNGASVSGATVQLGQAISAAGDPGKLLANTEVPLNNFSLNLRGTTGNFLFGNDGSATFSRNLSLNAGKLTFNAEGSGAQASLRSSTNMWYYANNNLHVFSSLGELSNNYTTLQFTTNTNTTAALYSGVLMGFDFAPVAHGGRPLLITTAGFANESLATGGDIIIKPGATQISNFQNHGLGDFNVILDPSGIGEVRALKTLNGLAGLKLKDSVSSSTTVTLTNGAVKWIFSGSSTATWTLPVIAGSTGLTFIIKNRGSANITLTAATNTIYSSAPTTTFTIAPGEAFTVGNDGTYWDILNN